MTTCRLYRPDFLLSSLKQFSKLILHGIWDPPPLGNKRKNWIEKMISKDAGSLGQASQAGKAVGRHSPRTGPGPRWAWGSVAPGEAASVAEGPSCRRTQPRGHCRNPLVRCVQGGASHPVPGLAAAWALCPWMVRMSSTCSVYFWLFPLHMEPAIGPDTFCFFKFSLVCDSSVDRGLRGGLTSADTQLPTASL